MFFFLVQTEQGDIFKITMEIDEDMVSKRMITFEFVLPVENKGYFYCLKCQSRSKWLLNMKINL